MTVWQVSSKKKAGSALELRDFPTWWRALLWATRKIRLNQNVVIVRIDE